MTVLFIDSHAHLDYPDYASDLEQVLKRAADERVRYIITVGTDIASSRRAVELIGGRAKTEASGGVTLQTVRELAECGVDYISVGMLTHSVQALDISLELEV